MDQVIVGNCECEHIAHFDKNWLTPNGNPGHKAGQTYHGLKAVKKTYGTFHVCSDCITDCHGV